MDRIMNDILSKNDYKFDVSKRMLTDFNDEEYTLVSSIPCFLLQNDDLKETLECFLTSLDSMYDSYEVRMSKFFIKSIMKRVEIERGYK